MSQVVDQVVDELRGAWRFRWIAMAAAWAVCLGGWLFVFAMPDMYEATAKVYVDTRTILKPLLEKLTVETDVESQLRLVRQAILGRPQLERVARETDLDLRAETPEQRAALIDKLRSRITIQGGAASSRDTSGGLYVISYQDENREKSIQVVEKLLNSFVEDTLGGNREGSETAQRFLLKQIEEYEARLSEAENRLAEFKKKNVGLMPGEQTGDYFSRLQNEIDATKKAESSLGVALSRREELQRQLRGEVPFLAAGSSTGGSKNSGGSGGGGSDTSTRIQETQARLDELLLRFTDKHPDVVATRETLEQLKQRRDAEVDALRRGDPSAMATAGAASNPVYQSIQLALNQVEVEIAALRGEIAEHNRKVGQLRGMVDTVPQVEAEFARLNRDYEVTREGYRELVDRLQKARLSERAEETGVVKFEVVDPPSAGFSPVAPNRVRLLAMVLVVGLAIGGGIAYLLHQLRPVFNNTRTLADITGLPVLGAVSMTFVDRKRAESRLRKIAFGGAAAALVVVFLGVVVFQSAGARFMQRLIS
ncbi:polysaccharide chain length determinant protein (PEP-CTERM system associated) [Povalibacter uvarum]|uniref:Polysaccharide chain length determinant protein (PEP-CTERM system associated) n=1 Tax=Povalibacter uvarum TaxID=732238 RepID=A0A841HH64_9GAMM|nr:XrtA system polysaccharide chain length determinant [Povalibacter uvarum]MBB6091628.1 polysaccharide chain length determinant protein (PEP-CTERM system associated) [Povalibacter uvarum]